MELITKHPIVCLAAVFFILCGCQTTDLGEPVRTIENPYNEEEYQRMSDSFVRDMELWRKDPEAVTQIEAYKLEGKNAVILDRKVIKASKDRHVVQVTTRKRIYVFYLDMPQFIQQVWWVSRIEVYALPSQRPEDNPALKKPPAELREPSSLTPVEDPLKKNPSSWDPTLP